MNFLLLKNYFHSITDRNRWCVPITFLTYSVKHTFVSIWLLYDIFTVIDYIDYIWLWKLLIIVFTWERTVFCSSIRGESGPGGYRYCKNGTEGVPMGDPYWVDLPWVSRHSGRYIQNNIKFSTFNFYKDLLNRYYYVFMMHTETHIYPVGPFFGSVLPTSQKLSTGTSIHYSGDVADEWRVTRTQEFVRTS